LPLTLATLDAMPLARYAAAHWIDHAMSGVMASTVLEVVLRFFTFESAPLKNWIRMYNIDGEWQQREEHSMDRADICSALYYSALAGLQEVSGCLLQMGENANAEGGWLGSALQAASYGGYEGIVKLLLENGAKLNAKGEEYGNALQAASFRGNKAIVKLLLDNGADVNAEGGKFSRQLHQMEIMWRL
jgi:hypothetical protein